MDSYLRNPNANRAVLLRDLYAAEAFLSLNAAAEGENFFEEEMKDAATEEARISAALILSQFQLLRHENSAFARLATDELLPYVVKKWKPGKSAPTWFGDDDTGLVSMSILALTPLATSDFLKTLPEEDVRKLLSRWTESRTGAKDDVPQLGMDLILRAAHDRLGQDKEKKEVDGRIDKSPVREALLPPEVDKNPASATREVITGYGQLIQWMRGL